MLGAAMAMSSTAIVVKLMAERLELESPHGKLVMGVLLFQDLAVVPLLVSDPGAEQQRRRDGRGAGLGRAEGGRAAGPAAVRRPEG